MTELQEVKPADETVIPTVEVVPGETQVEEVVAPEGPAPSVEEEDQEASTLQAAVEAAKTPEEKRVAQAAQKSAWAKLRRKAADAELGKIEAEKAAAFERGRMAEVKKETTPAAEKSPEPPAYVIPDFLKPIPKENDFEDYTEFQQAKDDWIAEKGAHIGYHRARADSVAEQARRETDNAKLQVRHWGEEGKKKYPDFIQVVSAHAETIPPVMAAAVQEEVNGHEIAYFLGKNPEEYQRIAGLSPLGQAREIGKLADRLKVAPPKPKTISNAPPPQKPIGGSETETFDPETADMNTYAAHHPSRKK